MAFKINEIIDLKGILFLTLLIVTSQATNLDCNGKAFHCVNSTHFMICVDLGRGTSTTIDNVIIPCPSPTVCRSTNRFECEFVLPSTTTTVAPVLPSTTTTVAPAVTTEREVATYSPEIITLLPEITTTLPEITTTLPEIATTLPDIATTLPEIATTLPEIATSSPEITTTSPEIAPTIPFEEYLNTVSTTTISRTDLPQSLPDTLLSVNPIGDGLNYTETLTTDSAFTEKSILSDVNTKLVTAADGSLNNARSVNNNETLNLTVIPKDAKMTSVHVTTNQPQITESSSFSIGNTNFGSSVSNDITATGFEQNNNRDNIATSEMVFTTDTVTETASLSTITAQVHESFTLPIDVVTDQTVTTERTFAETFKDATDVSTIGTLILLDTPILQTQDIKQVNEIQSVGDMMTTTEKVSDVSNLMVNASSSDVVSSLNEKNSTQHFLNDIVNETTVNYLTTLSSTTESINNSLQSVSDTTNRTDNLSNVNIVREVKINITPTEQLLVNVTEASTLNTTHNLPENEIQQLSLSKANKNSKPASTKDVVELLMNAIDITFTTTEASLSGLSTDQINVIQETTPDITNGSTTLKNASEQSSDIAVLDNFTELSLISTAIQINPVVTITPNILNGTIDNTTHSDVIRDATTEITPTTTVKIKEFDSSPKEISVKNLEIVTLLDVTKNDTNIADMAGTLSHQESYKTEMETLRPTLNTIITTTELVMPIEFTLEENKVKKGSCSEKLAVSSDVNKTTAREPMKNETTSLPNIGFSNTTVQVNESTTLPIDVVTDQIVDTTFNKNDIVSVENFDQSIDFGTAVNITQEALYSPNDTLENNSTNSKTTGTNIIIDQSLNLSVMTSSVIADPNPTTESVATIEYNNLKMFLNSNSTSTTTEVIYKNPQSDVEDIGHVDIRNTSHSLIQKLFTNDSGGKKSIEVNSKIERYSISSTPLESVLGILSNEEKTKLQINIKMPYEAQTESEFTTYSSYSGISTKDMINDNNIVLGDNPTNGIPNRQQQIVTDRILTTVSSIQAPSISSTTGDTEIFSSDSDKMTAILNSTTASSSSIANVNENRTISLDPIQISAQIDITPTNFFTTQSPTLMTTTEATSNNLPDTITTNYVIDVAETRTTTVVTLTQNLETGARLVNNIETGIKSNVNTAIKNNNIQDLKYQQFTTAKPSKHYINNDMSTASHDDRNGVIVDAQAQTLTEASTTIQTAYSITDNINVDSVSLPKETSLDQNTTNVLAQEITVPHSTFTKNENPNRILNQDIIQTVHTSSSLPLTGVTVKVEVTDAAYNNKFDETTPNRINHKAETHTEIVVPLAENTYSNADKGFLQNTDEPVFRNSNGINMNQEIQLQPFTTPKLIVADNYDTNSVKLQVKAASDTFLNNETISAVPPTDSALPATEITTIGNTVESIATTDKINVKTTLLPKNSILHTLSSYAWNSLHNLSTTSRNDDLNYDITTNVAKTNDVTTEMPYETVSNILATKTRFTESIDNLMPNKRVNQTIDSDSVTENYLREVQNAHIADQDEKNQTHNYSTRNTQSNLMTQPPPAENVIVNASFDNTKTTDIHITANTTKSIRTEIVNDMPKNETSGNKNILMNSTDTNSTITIGNKADTLLTLVPTQATKQETFATVVKIPLIVDIVNVQTSNLKENNVNEIASTQDGSVDQKIIDLAQQLNPIESIKFNISKPETINQEYLAPVSQPALRQTIVTVAKNKEEPFVSVSTSDNTRTISIIESTSETSNTFVVTSNTGINFNSYVNTNVDKHPNIGDWTDPSTKTTNSDSSTIFPVETTTLYEANDVNKQIRNDLQSQTSTDNLQTQTSSSKSIPTTKSSKSIPAAAKNENNFTSKPAEKDPGNKNISRVGQGTQDNMSPVNNKTITDNLQELIAKPILTTENLPNDFNTLHKINGTTVTSASKDLVNSKNLTNDLKLSTPVYLSISQTELPVISTISPTDESISTSYDINRHEPLITSGNKEYVINTEPTTGPIRRGLETSDNGNINIKLDDKVIETSTKLKTHTSKSENTKVSALPIAKSDVRIFKSVDDIAKATSFVPSSSSLSPVITDPTEVITTSDILVESKTGGGLTHSGIISLIAPKSQDKRKMSKIENDAEDEEKHSTNIELASLQNTGSILPSTDIPITTIQYIGNTAQRNVTTREELVSKTPSFNTANISKLSPNFNKEKNLHTDTNTAVSSNTKETPTHGLIENSTASTNDSHTSKNKSQDQNMNIPQAHNKTVISNDQSSTSRYVSQTKSTDTQTTRFPSLETTTRKPEINKLFCIQKKRGRYADKLDCRKFYICLGNKSTQVIEGTCPVNTVFSEINKQCTKNLSHCIRNNQFRCVTEGRFSDFLNDNVYYICMRNNLSQFIRFKLQCQNGYHLNKTSVRCDLNSESTSSADSKSVSEQSSSSTKREVTEKPEKTEKKKFKCKKEGVFPDSSNCKTYYECTKVDSSYQLKKKKCDSDEIFHKDKKKCVDSDSSEC